MKNKSALIIVIIIAILVVCVGLFAYLNTGDVEYKKELEMTATFEIKSGDITKQVPMEDMLKMEPVVVDAVLDTSTTDPTDVVFSGVELKTILEFVDLPLPTDGTIEVRSLDGYTSALSAEEVAMDDNVYICLAQSDEVLKPKSEGGMGPYLMIVKSSDFSQRWCKFVQEIVLP